MLWIGIALVACALVLNVISMRLRRRGAAPAQASDPVPDASTIDDATRASIDKLIASDNKIAAIKRLREAVPGMGLADAKAQIDRWGMPTTAPTPGPESIDPASLAEIDALIAEAKLIPAIKLVRERTGWGLAQAKHWVDARAGR